MNTSSLIKSVAIVAAIFTSLSGFGQFTSNQHLPKSEQRNADFVNRRTASVNDNFARSYYSANQSLTNSNVKFKSENEWTPIGPLGNERLAGMGRINAVQFHPNDSNTWFVCVAQGGVWKTTNAGESWTSISNKLPVLRTSYLSIHPNNPNTMYVALGDYAYLGHNLQANESKRNSHYGLGIYKTTDGGATWQPTGLSFEQTDFEGSLLAKVFIHKNNPDTLIAVGQTGAYRSNNGGLTWTETSSKLFWDLERDPDSDSILYASTGYVHTYGIGEAGILKSTDFGATWTEVTTTIPKTGTVQRIQLAVAPSDNNYIYALACDTDGGFYGFYQSTNAGTSFTKVLDNTYEYNILNWGFSQQPGGQGRYDLALEVDKNDKLKVTVGGVNIWQTKDGGNSFDPVSYWALNYQHKSIHADIHQIIQHPDNNSYFVCHDGGISRTHKIITDTVDRLQAGFTNTEWIHYRKGMNITSFYRLGINQSLDSGIMAGAQDNSTVFHTGSAFYNITGGDGMEAVFDDEAFYRYTSSQNGRIYAFFSASNSFDYEGVITPPSGEFGEWTTPFVAADGQIFVAYGNVYSYTSAYMNDVHSNFNNAPGTALDVEHSEAEIMYLGKRGYNSQNVENQILITQNGGNTWNNQASSLPRDLYPSYIDLNQQQPNEAWLVFSGFNATKKIYHTTNYGQSWTNITYDLPNIPVNCIQYHHDSTEYVFIGTDLGVFYMHKDSTSWKSLNNGLPKVIVSELEVDKRKKTLVAATFGRGLWEVEIPKALPKDTSTRSVQTLSERIGMEVSPNPSVNSIELRINGKDLGLLNLSIIDITGQVLHTSTLDAGQQTTTWNYNTSSMLPGEYFIILSNEHGRAVRRFVKI